MAFEANLFNFSWEAAADLSAKQFYLVKLDSNGKIALAGAGETAIGVLQDKPASGVHGNVMVHGISKVVAGGTIAAGDYIKADANGKGAVATKGRTDTSDGGSTTDALLGSNVVGLALSAADADDVFSMLILHLGAVPTTAS